MDQKALYFTRKSRNKNGSIYIHYDISLWFVFVMNWDRKIMRVMKAYWWDIIEARTIFLFFLILYFQKLPMGNLCESKNPLPSNLNQLSISVVVKHVNMLLNLTTDNDEDRWQITQFYELCSIFNLQSVVEHQIPELKK